MNKNKKDENESKPGFSLSRKNFLKQTSFSLLGLGLLPLAGAALHQNKNRIGDMEPAGYKSDETNLRTICYNVFNGCIGYKGINGHDLPDNADSVLVKTARDMGQIPKRIMLELALYQPGIINFSESPYEKVVAEMAKMLKLNYAYFPGAKSGDGHFPGSVLTNYKIISSETRPFVNKSRNDSKELFTRHWGKVKLGLPNGKTIILHSAHLWPFKKEQNDTDIRLSEIKELLSSIKYDLDHNADSVLLQGDLNHMPGTPEYDSLNNGGLIDVFKAVGKGDGYTTNAIKPVRRIDFIYAAGQIANHIKDCKPLFEGSFRMNNDDPKGFALSDHIPVMANFEI